MQMLWTQRNIWCIATATFKMIAMTSAHSVSLLSAVKPKQTRAAVVLIPPLVNLDPMSYPVPCKPTPLNPPLILLLSEQHRCLHIGHQACVCVCVCVCLCVRERVQCSPWRDCAAEFNMYDHQSDMSLNLHTLSRPIQSVIILLIYKIKDGRFSAKNQFKMNIFTVCVKIS